MTGRLWTSIVMVLCGTWDVKRTDISSRHAQNYKVEMAKLQKKYKLTLNIHTKKLLFHMGSLLDVSFYKIPKKRLRTHVAKDISKLINSPHAIHDKSTPIIVNIFN